MDGWLLFSSPLHLWINSFIVEGVERALMIDGAGGGG